MNVDPVAWTALLERYGALGQSRIADWRRLLGHATRTINSAYNRSLTRRETDTPGFNIFDITRRGHYEVTTHSAFLAHLLDPFELHGQGNLFLRAFVSLIEKMSGRVLPAQTARWQIDTEVAVDKEEQADGFTSSPGQSPSSPLSDVDWGRMDIVLRAVNPAFAVTIENKVYAGIQPGQLLRYWRWCERHYGSQFVLIYLTLHDSPPPREALVLDPSDPSQKGIPVTGIVNLSYRLDIAPLLEAALVECESYRVKNTVEQYLDLIQELCRG